MTTNKKARDNTPSTFTTSWTQSKLISNQRGNLSARQTRRSTATPSNAPTVTLRSRTTKYICEIDGGNCEEKQCCESFCSYYKCPDKYIYIPFSIVRVELLDEQFPS